MINGIQITTIMLCLLLFLPTRLQASGEMEYRRWASGQFVMPKDIVGVTSTNGLQSFLTNKDEFTRMAAVRRLGELEGARAIGTLLDICQKEPTPKGMDAMPLVKLEVVRTLGRIGNSQARTALVGMLRRYWQEGPKVKDKRGYRLDRDFTPVIHVLLRTLYPWGDEQEVFEQVKAIALSDDVRDYYTYPDDIGQLAWEVYLKGDTVRQGLKGEEDAGLYLFKFVEDLPRPEGPGTLLSVKRRATGAILTRYSEKALAALATKFEQELRQIPLVSEGQQTKRHIELRARIVFIEAVLRDRKTIRQGSAPAQQR